MQCIYLHSLVGYSFFNHSTFLCVQTVDQNLNQTKHRKANGLDLHLACFAPSGLSLHAHVLLALLARILRSQKFLKKSVFQSNWNALKRIEMKKKTPPFSYPFNPIRASCVAQIPSGKAQHTYPMSLPLSQGVSMPSFMPIGPKLWSLGAFDSIRAALWA